MTVLLHEIWLIFFLDFGPKTLHFNLKNASFHSHFNHCGSADPQESNLNQWLLSQKYAEGNTT